MERRVIDSIVLNIINQATTVHYFYEYEFGFSSPMCVRQFFPFMFSSCVRRKCVFEKRVRPFCLFTNTSMNLSAFACTRTYIATQARLNFSHHLHDHALTTDENFPSTSDRSNLFSQNNNIRICQRENVGVTPGRQCHSLTLYTYNTHNQKSFNLDDDIRDTHVIWQHRKNREIENYQQHICIK